MIVLKIVGIVLLCILLIIGVIILLPVDVVFLDDEKEGFKIMLRFLGKLYGEEPDPDNKILKEITKVTGADKLLDKKKVQSSLDSKGVSLTAREMLNMLKLFLGRVIWILPKGKLSKMDINYVCGGDAAEAAIEYGIACATLYPITAMIEDRVKTKRNASNVRLKCDFDAEKSLFNMDIELRFMIIYVLIALIYIIKENVKLEMENKKEDGQKNAG